MAADSHLFSFTSDDLRGLRREYDSFSAEIARLRGEQAAVRRKLEALILLWPEAHALLGDLPSLEDGEPSKGDQGNAPRIVRQRTRSEMPFTEAVLEILEGEKGGRSPRWFRERMLADPDFANRIEKRPTAVSNALSRGLERGRLCKSDDGLYYLPDTFKAIEEGVMEDERIENDGTPSFNSMMHRVMEALGRPFNAADAIDRALQDPFLSERMKDHPNKVYSWISREVFKRKLIKDGEYYSYPSERDGAPNGDAAGAPTAGEAATSPLLDRMHRLNEAIG